MGEYIPIQKLRSKTVNEAIRINIPITFVFHPDPTDDYFEVSHNHPKLSRHQEYLLKRITKRFGATEVKL